MIGILAVVALIVAGLGLGVPTHPDAPLRNDVITVSQAEHGAA